MSKKITRCKSLFFFSPLCCFSQVFTMIVVVNHESGRCDSTMSSAVFLFHILSLSFVSPYSFFFKPCFSVKNERVNLCVLFTIDFQQLLRRWWLHVGSDERFQSYRYQQRRPRELRLPSGRHRRSSLESLRHGVSISCGKYTKQCSDRLFLYFAFIKSLLFINYCRDFISTAVPRQLKCTSAYLIIGVSLYLV